MFFLFFSPFVDTLLSQIFVALPMPSLTCNNVYPDRAPDTEAFESELVRGVEKADRALVYLSSAPHGPKSAASARPRPKP